HPQPTNATRAQNARAKARAGRRVPARKTERPRPTKPTQPQPTNATRAQTREPKPAPAGGCRRERWRYVDIPRWVRDAIPVRSQVCGHPAEITSSETPRVVHLKPPHFCKEFARANRFVLQTYLFVRDLRDRRVCLRRLFQRRWLGVGQHRHQRRERWLRQQRWE